MEEMLFVCYGAEKLQWPADTPHKSRWVAWA
jgi:hypothetical protein